MRITAVSLPRGAALGKIGVTCRQPFLGAFEWIEEDVAKAQKGGVKKAEQKEKEPVKPEKKPAKK